MKKIILFLLITLFCISSLSFADQTIKMTSCEEIITKVFCENEHGYMATYHYDRCNNKVEDIEAFQMFQKIADKSVPTRCKK